MFSARQWQTVPDLHEALVTSLFQQTEMEFDSGCSCPESSRGCIKKASQQCWQEYIYWDCVSFQEAAKGGAGCHRSHWLAGRPFDLQPRWIVLHQAGARSDIMEQKDHIFFFYTMKNFFFPLSSKIILNRCFFSCLSSGLAVIAVLWAV